MPEASAAAAWPQSKKTETLSDDGRTELRPLADACEGAEVELRAAMLMEGAERARIAEPDKAGTGFARECRSFDLSAVLASLTDSTPLSGREAEVSAELEQRHGAGQKDTRFPRDALEQRADVATDTQSAIGGNLASRPTMNALDRFFEDSVAGRFGVTVMQVSGAPMFPEITAGGALSWVAEAAGADAAAIATTTRSPAIRTANGRCLLTRQAIRRNSALAAILHRDLSEVLRQGVDLGRVPRGRGEPTTFCLCDRADRRPHGGVDQEGFFLCAAVAGRGNARNRQTVGPCPRSHRGCAAPDADLGRYAGNKYGGVRTGPPEIGGVLAPVFQSGFGAGRAGCIGEACVHRHLRRGRRQRLRADVGKPGTDRGPLKRKQDGQGGPDNVRLPGRADSAGGNALLHADCRSGSGLMMDKRATWPVRGLELRREGKRPAIAGRFACGDLATIADRGQLRKEHIMAKAFSFAPDRQDDREINLPFGHDFDKPSASRRNGSLILDDPDDAPTFFATIADELMDVTHVREASAMLGAGLVTGISPGFRVPLKRTVPNAERLDPEPGTPGVFIRTLLARVLYELSLVTRPAYAASQAELRALKTAAHPVRQDRIWLP